MIRITLVGPEIEENLSLRYLASSLTAAGFSSTIVPFNRPEDLAIVLATLLESGEPPALVGLSLAFQWRAKDFLALAVALRQHGFAGHITAGGHFGTFACREILRDFPEIDSICRHEAEHTLVSLAIALSEGKGLVSIRGLACRDIHGSILLTDLPAVPDLERLPWPERHGPPAECLGHRMAPLVASRGCYGHCSFCCISAWHEQTMPGKRFRLRPIADVAEEMSQLHHNRGIEVFIFHDDNFFLPNRSQTLRRIDLLADRLEERGVRNFATIVKARPNDLKSEVLAAMRQRLRLLRVYVGIENASDSGLRTLRRGVDCAENHRALELLNRSGVFPCFNLLMFEPSATIAGLKANLSFMERHATVPNNFGRVELYAGTPLLAQLQAEGRCTGDYLAWDYQIADASVQRVFEIAMKCFYTRNFSDEATPHRLMQARFSVEIAAHFHASIFRESWRAEAKRLAGLLTDDSVQGMREIITFVETGGGRSGEMDFALELAGKLRRAERVINAAADVLDCEIVNAIVTSVGESHHGKQQRA